MKRDEFFTAEHKLHVTTDKVYRMHLKNMENLTKRQVVAQEQLVKSLKVILKENQ